jgi:DNA helicase INO80
MSFSNILSSTAPVAKPRSTSPLPDDTPIKTEKADHPERMDRADKEKKPRRSTKSRVSDIRNSESTPKPSSRRASSKLETPAPSARLPAKRLANGHPKHKVFSDDNEKKIQEHMNRFDAESGNEDDLLDELQIWEERNARRIAQMHKRDRELSRLRRSDYSEKETLKLKVHSDLGKRRFDDVNYDDALQKVREREIFAEKERKKDMQRKRRREKSMAATMEQKAAALARANAAKDDAERRKFLREAERANKKVQQTKLVLQRGHKGPSRNLASIEPNL